MQQVPDSKAATKGGESFHFTRPRPAGGRNIPVDGTAETGRSDDENDTSAMTMPQPFSRAFGGRIAGAHVVGRWLIPPSDAGGAPPSRQVSRASGRDSPFQAGSRSPVLSLHRVAMPKHGSVMSGHQGWKPDWPHQRPANAETGTAGASLYRGGHDQVAEGGAGGAAPRGRSQ